MLIDGNTLKDEGLSCKVCIIGSGPAGTTLAYELAKQNIDVIVVESGGKFGEVESNALNDVVYKSNFTFRTNFANRHRQVGGSANLWAGRVVPFKFEPGLDDEWGELPKEVELCKKSANSILDISNDLVARHPDIKGSLVAFWAKKNQKFNYRSKQQAQNYRVVYHLTYSGNAQLEGSTFKSVTFKNSERKDVTINADKFIIATGGIENSRILLLMEEQLKPLMKENFNNVGRYFMEHPKVTYGSLNISKNTSFYDKYSLKIERDGKVKYGLKNTVTDGVRVYTNLVDEKSDLVAKVYAKIANLYKKLTNKVYVNSTAENKSADLIKDLIYMLEPEELLPHYLLYKFSNVKKSSKGSRKMKLITYFEQLPDFNNRVTLSTEIKDRFGVPIPEVTLNVSNKEVEAVVQFYNELSTLFAQNGGSLKYKEDYLRNTSNYTEASHHIGGTRYSTNVAKAVVDGSFKVIGTDNLYVMGCSVFPTGGVENPTYLIVCLSCYLAGLITKEYNNA